jgi:hypothetical protein
MSNQKVYYETLSGIQKRIFKQQLKQDGKFICLGKLCNGQIKKLNEFPFQDIEKCGKCYKETLVFKNNRTLKKIYKNVKFERKINKEIVKEWKSLKY